MGGRCAGRLLARALLAAAVLTSAVALTLVHPLTASATASYAESVAADGARVHVPLDESAYTADSTCGFTQFKALVNVGPTQACPTVDPANVTAGATGQVGRAAHLSGNDGMSIETYLPNGGFGPGAGEGTIELWARSSGLAQGRESVLVSTGVISVRVTPAGKVYLALQGMASAPSVSIVGGSYRHVAVVIDEHLRVATLWVDGDVAGAVDS